MPAFLTWLTSRDAATTLDGTELFIAEQANGNVRVTADQIASRSGGAFSSVAAAMAYSFFADTQATRVSGYATAGDGGAATYVRAGSQPVHDGWFQSADGAYWELDEREPNCHMFGAVADNSTDDTLAIQSTVNYCLYKSYPVARLLTGKHVTTDTIHLGFTGFSSIVLKGANYPGVDGSSSWLVPQFLDRPVVNIQGGRASGVVDCFIYNQSTALPYQNPVSTSLVSAADQASYIPTGATTDSRAPFCGVCIDGYSGTVPANPYPIPTYPSWMSQPGTDSDAYNQVTSSNCRVRAYIDATFIGICVQPNADANGDFLDFADSFIVQQAIGVSINNVNARVTNFSRINFNICHTCFDTTFGRDALGAGNMQGNFIGVHVNQSYRIFNFVGDNSQPTAFVDCYSENTMRIGDASGGMAGLSFIGCSFSVMNARYSGASLVEEYVERVIDAVVPIYFTSTFLNLSRVFFPFRLNPAFEGCWFRPLWATDGSTANSAEKSAVGAMGTLGVYPQLAPESFSAPLSMRNCHVYNAAGDLIRYSCIDTTELQTIHGGALAYQGVNSPYVVHNQARPSTIGSLFSGSSISGREVTVTTSEPFQGGDLLFAAGYNGTWFYADSVTGSGPYDVVLIPLYNYKLESGVYSLFDSSVASGTSYRYPISMLRSPQSDIYYSTTSGSPTVSCVDRSGSAVAPPADVAAGDSLLWVGTVVAQYGNVALKLPFDQNVVVDTVNATSLTMTGNATKTAYWQCGPGIARADV